MKLKSLLPCPALCGPSVLVPEDPRGCDCHVHAAEPSGCSTWFYVWMWPKPKAWIAQESLGGVPGQRPGVLERCFWFAVLGQHHPPATSPPPPGAGAFPDPSCKLSRKSWNLRYLAWHVSRSEPPQKHNTLIIIPEEGWLPLYAMQYSQCGPLIFQAMTRSCLWRKSKVQVLA